MKAIVYTKYGSPDVLELCEVEKPTPKDDDVLVEVRASSVNYANLAFVRGKPLVIRPISGLLKPKYKIPGGDLAGRVEAVGSTVKQFQPGDEVFGDVGDCCRGAFAEFVSAPEKELALKPSNLSFQEAAAVPQAALVALQGLGDVGEIQSETSNGSKKKVLIVGASGGNGTFAVQLAKSFGAEVTGVCNTKNLELVRSIGADQVIDYTQEDVTQIHQRYDLILAMAGDLSIFDYKRALSPNGIYVMTGGSMKQIFQAMLLGPLISTGGKKLRNLSHLTSQSDLVYMKELIEAGKVNPVIDKRYPLSETADALRYYAKGHSRGKVVITINR